MSPIPASPPAPPPVLILGTGRCGSTLLSAMVRDHPETLSVSELFSFVTDLGMRIERAFPAEPISGQQFWRVLADPQPRQSMLLASGLQMPEVTYPWATGRFTPDQGLPPILQALLPHLEPDAPDALFDRLAGAVSSRPHAPVGDHYRALFGELLDRFDKRLWVERSGGSLRLTERLLSTFPEARVLHLVRDGRDTALSMSGHIGFRMALLCGLQAELLGVDPYESADRDEEDDLSEELAAVLPECFDRDAFERFDLPPALCGHYWSGEIQAGLAALDHLRADRLLTIRYEDLVASPHETVAIVGDFLTGRACPDWVERAAQMVEQRPSRWPDLPSADRDELHTACQPGFNALAEHGLNWS